MRREFHVRFCERAEVQLLRATRLIVVAKNREQAEGALELTQETLHRLQLKLNPVKTRIVSFDEGFEFLGWNFVRSLAVPSRRRETPLTAGTLTRAHAPSTVDVMRPVDSKRRTTEDATSQLAQALTDAQASHPEWEPRQFVDSSEGESPDTEQSLASDSAKPEVPYDTIKIAELTPSTPDDMSKQIDHSAMDYDSPPDLPAPGCIQRTLYLVEAGAELGKEGERLQVRKDGRVLLEVPVIQVDQVMIFGPNSITPAAMQLCLKNKTPIALLSKLGRYHGRVDGQDFSHLELQRAQFVLHADGGAALTIAKSMQFGKLENSALLLSRYGRHRSGLPAETFRTTAVDLRDASRRLHAAATLDSIRGIEGAAAAAYFKAWRSLLDPDWGFAARKSHPPPDPINVLLSFGYTILYNCVAGLLQARGLNPHLGFLHAGSSRHMALASDLMEEFRAIVVDACILNLCVNGRLRREDFRTTDQGCSLQSEGSRVFIRALEDKLNSVLVNPRTGDSMDLRRIIDAQVVQLCDVVRHGPAARPYVACVFR